MTHALKIDPVRIETSDGRFVLISPDDVEWIAERMFTAPDGKVSFYSSAVNIFRRLTGQLDVPPYRLRAQMLRAFGRLA